MFNNTQLQLHRHHPISRVLPRSWVYIDLHNNNHPGRDYWDQKRDVMLEFVQVSSHNDFGQDVTAQRRVRSQAMKDYRQRQRAARQAQKGAKPASIDAKQKASTQRTSNLAPKAAHEVLGSTPEIANIDVQQSIEARLELSRPMIPRDVVGASERTEQVSNGSSNQKKLSPAKRPTIVASSRNTSPCPEFSSRSNGHKSLELLQHWKSHIAFLASPAAIRTQLLAKFLDIHLLQLPMRAVAGSRWLTLLPSEDLSSPLIQNCVDAVCLAKIGSHHNNHRALQLSSTRYGRTLHLLNQTLTRPTQHQIRADHILVSMSLLALCELFNPVTNGGWIKHIKGAESYLLAVGKKAVQSELGRSHLHGVRHFSFVMAMIQRRAVVLADEHWKVLNSKNAAAPRDPYVDIYDIALHVPGLLERADMITSTGKTKVEADHITATADSDQHLTILAILLYDIEHILHRLEEWLNKWYNTAEGKAYIEVSTTTAATSSLGSLIGFRDAETCTFHQLYWLCSMLLHWTTVEVSKNTASCHKITALDHALKFLRSVPLCPCAKVGSISRCSIWLSLVLEPYLARHGHKEEAGWCRDVMEAIEGEIDFTGVRGWELEGALLGDR